MRQLHVVRLCPDGGGRGAGSSGDDAGRWRPGSWRLSSCCPASAEPEACPPVCDQIPNTAWIRPARGAAELGVQLARAGRSGGAGDGGRGGAVPVRGALWRASRCRRIRAPRRSRARATVVHPDGQWQLQAQILHWRGDTARGGSIAASVFGNAVAALRGCQLGAPPQSPSITVDEPNRMAAVISGPVIMHSLPGRARSEQHDQRADAVVVGAAASALAVDGGQSGAGRDDRAIVRCLYRLVPVSRRRQLPPVELAPRRI